MLGSSLDLLLLISTVGSVSVLGIGPAVGVSDSQVLAGLIGVISLLLSHIGKRILKAVERVYDLETRVVELEAQARNSGPTVLYDGTERRLRAAGE